MADILVAGSLHLDVMVTAPHLPRLDQTVAGQGVSYVFGGKGGNQALAAARMGAQVAMAGAVGSDGFAETILAALDAGGVRRTRVRHVQGPSGMSVAIVDASGGWKDAGGDNGKYLSHLSYANFFNPQQAGLTAWALARAYDAAPRRFEAMGLGPEVLARDNPDLILTRASVYGPS